MNDYAKGFKEGFAAGLEEGKKLSQPQIGWPSPSPYFELKETCPKCGIKINGVMGYVCSSPNCPTYPQVTCDTVVKGAVGSSYYAGVGSAGGNGAAGSMMGARPTIEEEKERLNRYNQVWINGQWCELGS